MVSFSPEFWAAFRFGLECAPDADDDPFGHTDHVIKQQSTYTWDDVSLILFPLLKRHEMAITYSSYITEEGTKALETLRRGEVPVLKSPAPFDEPWIREEATRRATHHDYRGDLPDFFANPDGYVVFFHAMLQLDLDSPFTGTQWYIWNQVLLILQGKLPVSRVILEPLFKGSKELEVFLSVYLVDQKDFQEWIYYAEDVCPVV